MPSPFVKGNKLGKGRPKGSKNKDNQNYLDFQLWFKNALADYEAVHNPNERFNMAIMIIDRLLSKVQTLPGTPAESVENVKKMLADLETKNLPVENKPQDQVPL